MSDDEFDLLDELYFVQSYDYLKEAMDWEDDQILNTLTALHNKGWLKCYRAMDEEVFDKDLDLPKHFRSYLYLATKKGLMAHNGR